MPALLTGSPRVSHAPVGEYGSVIFIAGNMPMVNRITPLMIITKLEQYDYAGATAIAVVMLLFVFAAARHQCAAGLVRAAQGGNPRHGWKRAATCRRAAQRRRARRPGSLAHRHIRPQLHSRCSCPAGGRLRRGAAQGLGHLAAWSTRRPAAIRLTLTAAPIAVPSTWSSAWPRPGPSPSSSSAARPADHADRPALLGLAGGGRPDLSCAWRAGLARARGWRRTTSRSSSPCRASCWPRCS